MRILVVKLSSLGDIVHTLPAVAAVKRRFPESEISWAVGSDFAGILQNNPLLSGLIEIDTKILRRGEGVPGKKFKAAIRQLRGLRNSDFDLAIDFQGLLKSASIAKVSRARHRYGFDKENLREPASRVFLTERIRVRHRQNVIFKNMDLAESSLRRFLSDPDLALGREPLEFPVDIERVHDDEAEEIIGQDDTGFALLNPAAGWSTKRWYPENYARLAALLQEAIGLRPIITTAPGEKQLAESVIASCELRVSAVTPSLKGFCALAKRATVYIGGDTGPTHLAVAVGCPVVGIYGPTEWWRNGSPFDNDVNVGRDDINCRIDCHRRTCGKWICMDIPAEKVLEAVRQRIG